MNRAVILKMDLSQPLHQLRHGNFRDILTLIGHAIILRPTFQKPSYHLCTKCGFSRNFALLCIVLASLYNQGNKKYAKTQ